MIRGYQADMRVLRCRGPRTMSAIAYWVGPELGALMIHLYGADLVAVPASKSRQQNADNQCVARILRRGGVYPHPTNSGQDKKQMHRSCDDGDKALLCTG